MPKHSRGLILIIRRDNEHLALDLIKRGSARKQDLGINGQDLCLCPGIYSKITSRPRSPLYTDLMRFVNRAAIITLCAL